MNKKNITKYTVTKTQQKIKHYFLSVIIVGVTALLCIPLSNTQSYYVVSFILLFVVSFMATFMGIGPVLVAASLSALVWNFFFIPPHYTFHIEKAEDILMFGMFFIIALLNGILTTRVRRQEQLAKEREKRTNALFQITKELSKANGIEEVVKVAIENIKLYFSLDTFIILQNGENILQPSKRIKSSEILSKQEFELAKQAFEKSTITGRFSNFSPNIEHSFFPLIGTRLNPGVVVVRQKSNLSGTHKNLWDTFLTQISNALEREFLGELAQKVRFLDESDRLYKTLFNSISHELRIPISTIMGASDTIISSDNSKEVQTELCQEIFTASLRLNRLVENLLNMSRLESGHFSVRLDWYDLNDLVNKVIKDLCDELEQFRLKVDIEDEMPLVKIDFGLIEQVLYNLLINSTQYAPISTIITLRAHHEKGNLVIEVEDEGPGFPETELKNVFRKFFKVNNRKTGGLGLGLSIVKGFVEAHNGSISVANAKNSGAKFSIQIPSEKPDIRKQVESLHE
jgi:two-component system sensor histidine kinase KdpD